MEEHPATVAYCFVPNFKQQPVFLFAAHAQALIRLSELFDELSRGPRGFTKILDAEPLFQPKRGTRLTITIGAASTGMRRLESGAAERRFEWRITRELAGHFARLTRELALTEGAGHQYLDSDANEAITVVVSKGEYDENVVQRS